MRSLFCVDLHLEQIDPKLNVREVVTRDPLTNLESQSK